MEMYEAPMDLSRKALVPIDLFLSGESSPLRTSRGAGRLPVIHSCATCFVLAAGRNLLVGLVFSVARVRERCHIPRLSFPNVVLARSLWQVT